MPRQAAVTHPGRTPSSSRSTQRITLTLSDPDAIAVWEVWVARHGSTQAAFDALLRLAPLPWHTGTDDANVAPP